jgi:hypothetical protein
VGTPPEAVAPAGIDRITSDTSAPGELDLLGFIASPALVTPVEPDPQEATRLFATAEKHAATERWWLPSPRCIKFLDALPTKWVGQGCGLGHRGCGNRAWIS